MTVAMGDNMPRIRERIAFTTAVYPWVQMLVFSELSVFGPDTRLAQPMPGPTEQELCALAKQYGIWLLPGSLYELADGVIYNTTPVIDPNGVVVTRHRKTFPFTPYEVGVTPGDTWTVFDVPGVGRFGVSICYDRWFPETSRTLACMGAEVLLHPSLTGTIDRDIELSIGRATAAQNQMFVFDINGCGVGGNGQSQVIAPGGEVLYLAGRAEEVIPLEIDLDRVRRSREVGLRGLGQPLKSFRDRTVEFPAYPKSAANLQHLQQLGPLAKPVRGSLAGLQSKVD
jgi:predicted amidohydrolase